MADPKEDKESQIIEAMAKAMAIADGDFAAEWQAYTTAAKSQYRAYLVMQATIMELGASARFAKQILLFSFSPVFIAKILQISVNAPC